MPNKIINLSVDNVAYNTVNKTIELVNTTDFNFGNIALNLETSILDELIIFVRK